MQFALRKHPLSQAPAPNRISAHVAPTEVGRKSIPEEAKFYLLTAGDRSEDMLTEDGALRQASLDDQSSHCPTSIACVERGVGRIVYTGRTLKAAIKRWREAHPDE